MSGWLEFAEGPLFRFAGIIMIIGLLRLVIVSIVDIIMMSRKTPANGPSFGSVIAASAQRLNPFRWLQNSKRGAYTMTSVVFHVGLIIVPLFYLPHLQMLRSGLGFAWPAISAMVADVLTIVTIVTGIALVILRYSDRGSREMSRFQDWILTPLCVVVFITGFLSAHISGLPFNYEWTRFIHVVAGSAVMIALPFTKLAHVVLLPFTTLVTELGWKFVPGVGARVREAFGQQDKPV